MSLRDVERALVLFIYFLEVFTGIFNVRMLELHKCLGDFLYFRLKIMIMWTELQSHYYCHLA